MNNKVHSINFEEKDLRIKELLIKKDIIYNYSIPVVTSTTVNYEGDQKESLK